MQWDENDYRQKIRETLSRIEKAFEDVDPDVAECEQAQGSLTIRLADGSRCIVSAQPSVRQLWLAVAAKGVAYHFNYELQTGHWLDDKGRNIELLSFLQQHMGEAAGLSLVF